MAVQCQWIFERLADGVWVLSPLVCYDWEDLYQWSQLNQLSSLPHWLAAEQLNTGLLGASGKTDRKQFMSVHYETDDICKLTSLCSIVIRSSSSLKLFVYVSGCAVQQLFVVDADVDV